MSIDTPILNTHTNITSKSYYLTKKSETMKYNNPYHIV